MIRNMTLTAIAILLAGTVSPAPAMPNASHRQVSSAHMAGEPQKEGPPITGKVLQSMNSGGYTYVLVQKKGDEKLWLAMPQTTVNVGDQMTFRSGMQMANFESKTLKRTFDRIIFSEGPVNPVKGSLESRKSPGSKGAVTQGGKIKVEKATGPNAHTIADIYRLKGKLDKKKVVVRGQVVKVSSGIMGKNWIHLQDGSGSAKKGNNNLVVTSQATPLVGDVVTATGTLHKDKDFGGGYRYEVIVEKATIANK